MGCNHILFCYCQCIEDLHYSDLLNTSMSESSSVTMPQSVRWVYLHPHSILTHYSSYTLITHSNQTVKLNLKTYGYFQALTGLILPIKKINIQKYKNWIEIKLPVLRSCKTCLAYCWLCTADACTNKDQIDNLVSYYSWNHINKMKFL